MTYDPQAHRANTRTHVKKLAASGPGWHAYALRRAEDLEKQNPTLHAGLTADVEAQLGPQATKEARIAAKWMGGR